MQRVGMDGDEMAVDPKITSPLRRLAEAAKAAAARERAYPPCDWHDRATATAAYIALGMRFDEILALVSTGGCQCALTE
jgi:hypothetical protein